MSAIVRSLVREILSEMQAYKRVTGKKYTADIEMFRDNVGKPGYYIHLTDQPKVGVNPRSDFLPGTYMYRNTRDNFLSVLGPGESGSDVSGARYGRYVFLLKLKGDVKMLRGGNELADYIDKKYKAAVMPVLDELLDSRLMREPENVEKYYDKEGNFTRWYAVSSTVPSLKVTPELLSRIGDSTFVDNINDVLDAAEGLREILPLKSKARTQKAIEANEKVFEVLKGLNMVPKMEDGAPIAGNSFGSWNETLYGPKVGKSGVVSPQGVAKGIANLHALVSNFTTTGAGSRPEIDDRKVKEFSEKVMKERYASSPILDSISSRYQSTAYFYFFIARASASSSRTVAIQGLTDGKFKGTFVGKDGQPISGKYVSDRVLEAICNAMSYPGKKVTPEFLKKYYGEEELNILLALGGTDYDGVEDLGATMFGSRKGVLGRETSQTFVKAPIGPKLEGGEPVVMVDRLEGEREDLELHGSIHQGNPWDPAPPRAKLIGGKRGRTEDQVGAIRQRTGKTLSRAKERYSTALDIPKEEQN